MKVLIEIELRCRRPGFFRVLWFMDLYIAATAATAATLAMAATAAAIAANSCLDYFFAPVCRFQACYHPM